LWVQVRSQCFSAKTVEVPVAEVVACRVGIRKKWPQLWVLEILEQNATAKPGK
jgi:hypothetical protein